MQLERNLAWRGSLRLLRGCGRRQHRLRILENAPQRTTQFHRLTQRRSAGQQERRIRELTSWITDPFDMGIPGSCCF